MTSTVNGQTTKYIWSRGAKLDRLLAKINPDNSVTRYVYGTGLLYEETTDASGTVLSTLYYHFDWRGDTVALTDDGGYVVARMSYSPYGERTVESGAVNTPFCFNGQFGVMTEQNGLYCMQARFYSPVYRRFLNEDPSGFSGGGNLYAYAGGDPVNLMDPFGLGPTSTSTASLAWGTVLEMGSQFAQSAQNTFNVANEMVIKPMNQAIDAAASGIGWVGDQVLPGSGEGVKNAAVFGSMFIPVAGEERAAAEVGTEVVQRAMSRAELEATQSTGLLRGGREGTHYVSDAVNSTAGRAQQRLALPQAPEVRVTLEVPGNTFSAPTRVQPKFNMPGQGMERTATGSIPVKILGVDNL